MTQKGMPSKVRMEAADIRGVTKAIPPELSRFDELPDSALVRLPVVQGLLGCSSSAVWRNVKAGHLPAPVKVTPNCTGWRVGELRAVLKLAAA